MSRFLSIDLDPQGLFVVAGTVRGGTARVEHALAWVPGEDHGPPTLTAATAKGIGEQLRDRLKAAGVQPAPALVAVGRDKIIIKELKFPAVAPAEEPALVRFQALKEITENPDDVVLDYAPLADAAPGPDGERRAVAVVVRKDVFAAVQAMCTAAGLKLAGVTPRPFAAAAGLTRALAAGAAPHLDPADASAAVLTLGPQGGEFTVVRGGQVAFTRSVPAPALANEALLVAEVRRNLAMYSGQHPVRAVYVAEAEDLLGGWANRLRSGLTVPVHTFDPVAGAAESVPDKLRGRYAGAAGLLAARAAGLPINFAAPRQPVVEKDPNRKLYALAGAAAAVLLLAGGVFGFIAVGNAEEEYAGLVEQKASLEKQLADAEPFRKKLDAADQWASREVNWLDELFDLAARIPAGDQVRVTKVETTPVRPDAKTGKQTTQAVYKVSIGARTEAAVSKLFDEVVRENTATAKYYVGTQRTGGNVVPNTAPFSLHYTITTNVNHRPPTAYTRNPQFVPPRRGAILTPTTPPPAAKTEPAKEPDPKPAEDDDEPEEP